MLTKLPHIVLISYLLISTFSAPLSDPGEGFSGGVYLPGGG